MKNLINLFVLSDIHLGHHINKTSRMVKLLFWFINKYKSYLDKSDIVIISGDIYDRLLNSNSKDYEESIQFLTYLLKYCNDKDIKVRILEGTPSHDMRQIKILYNIINDLKLDIDFKYVDTLSIEHMENLDIDVMYLPDEWKSNPIAIWKDIKALLKKENKDKVDIVVMHGGFKYQLPLLMDHMHDEKLFVNLTYGGPVISGHVHSRSIYKNIIIPGSFDRLTFNDEGEDKGGVFITYNKELTNFTFKYLNNRHALTFITFDLTKSNLKSVVKDLKRIKQKEAHIRFLVKKEANIIDSLIEIESMFPTFRFTIKVLKDKDNLKNEDILSLRKDLKENTKLDKNIIEDYIKTNIKDTGKLNTILDEFRNILKTI